MAFLVGKVDGNIAADGIQLLAGRHIVLKGHQIPPLAEYRFCSIVSCFLDRSGYDFLQELFGTVFITDNRSYGLDGIAKCIVGVTITAAWHYKTLVGVVHHFGLTLFHKGFGSRLVAYIDILTVLHGKGFYHVVALGGVNLTIDHEVGSGLAVTTGQYSHRAANQDGGKHP